ncbi:MAG TPA: hypothetical protein VIU64_18975 [Polyangia bacterium]
MDAVRPTVCPCCGCAGQPVGARLGIVGHGLRERQQRGPTVAGGAPRLIVIRARRYACQCGAILTVVPRETLPGRLYTISAVAWALALFGVDGVSLCEVRHRTSPWAIVGATAIAGWATLRRWVAAVRARRLLPDVRPCPVDFTARQVAARAATTISALARPDFGAPIAARAFVGAARAA